MEKSGDRPWVFVTDKRPKFTAKTRRSPSLRTRQEAPGADQSILNRKNAGTVPGVLFYVPLEFAEGAISFNPQPTARNLTKPPRTLRLGPSRSAIPAGQHDPFGAGPIAIARGLRPSGSRKPGDRTGVFCL